MDVHLDCGELLPGHRFLITGIRHDGQSDDQLHSDLAGHVEGQPGEPMVAVTYEVRPGLSERESTLYVDAKVELRPTPTGTFWETTSREGGGVVEERDRPVGGPVTTGAFGPFVCPEGTEEIALSLRPIQVEVLAGNSRALAPDTPDLLAGVELVTGTATLDVLHRSARWTPDRSD